MDHNLKIIVVINKIDRKDARPQRGASRNRRIIFCILPATKITFPSRFLYAIGREEKAWDHLPKDPGAPATLEPLFQALLKYVPRQS